MIAVVDTISPKIGIILSQSETIGSLIGKLKARLIGDLSHTKFSLEMEWDRLLARNLRRTSLNGWMRKVQDHYYTMTELGCAKVQGEAPFKAFCAAIKAYDRDAGMGAYYRLIDILCSEKKANCDSLAAHFNSFITRCIRLLEIHIRSKRSRNHNHNRRSHGRSRGLSRGTGPRVPNPNSDVHPSASRGKVEISIDQF